MNLSYIHIPSLQFLNINHQICYSTVLSIWRDNSDAYGLSYLSRNDSKDLSILPKH